ncbi:baseplate J/gp47 family protein [Aureimonas ureilytica]|uniref:baseplate J/gp47 family protein n=1 Tax=Aureimonas ureilytica TaxID=401562 RepID=UPI00035DC84F|nr:baseplate J/gp47 family protein [Aureimonas ureilytica]
MRAPTAIDLSAVPLPAAIETFTPATLRAAFKERFLLAWAEERARDATLPAFTIGELEANPVAILGRVFSFLRLLDRQRVNDVVRSVFVTTAAGADLDALVARQNVQRLVLQAATPTSAVVMESDAALARRYLLSFDRGSAGSADRFLYEAWTAWPQMGDARVNGYAVHKRRGDTHIVVAGPGGRAPTAAELALVEAACLASHVAPEAIAVSVLPATPVPYRVRLRLDIRPGPDKALVEADILSRAKAAAEARCVIGGEVPTGFFRGIAFGNVNVLEVEDLAPVVIAADPYKIPALLGATVEATVRA